MALQKNLKLLLFLETDAPEFYFLFMKVRQLSFLFISIGQRKQRDTRCQFNRAFTLIKYTDLCPPDIFYLSMDRVKVGNSKIQRRVPKF